MEGVGGFINGGDTVEIKKKTILSRVILFPHLI